ncbi:peptidoglycan editing factor PgeF [Corynebacterium durum]|jgi:conserved hypothetical protein, YfiH family|uniref:peptidoglycan editing factor PgeF n=1 Tax=Corynebacterium durum TaxID=61592 RepID=UPI0028804015|nr:peptidoglycan editing factor PgeF [Corynebacterium durum]
MTLKPRPVHKVFTTRTGGVSAAPFDSFNLGDHVGDDPQAVAANRARLASIIGVSDFVWMEQLHTNTVTVVDAPQIAPATDAVVTTQRGLALAVLTADCVPLLLSDDRAGVIAAVHAGRLGARNDILLRTLDAMESLGSKPETTHVLLGAAASGKRYEVPKEMADDFEAAVPGSRTRTEQGTWGIDIRAGLVRQLLSRGVKNIDVNPHCTIKNEHYFSYRREGKTGRQAGVIWLSHLLGKDQ